MSNYDMDEIVRQRERERKGSVSVEIGKEEVPHTAVDIEIGDEDFMKVAQEAQRRDITFNKMVNIILKDGLKNATYKFEHHPKAQLLNETE